LKPLAFEPPEETEQKSGGVAFISAIDIKAYLSIIK
jgi:hypothetical protein